MAAIGLSTRTRLTQRVWPQSSAAVRTRRRVAIWLLVPLAIELLAWPVLSLNPVSGLEPSWRAGLYLATHNHLAFGTQAVFTFGPLGFLSIPMMWFSGMWQLALLYMLLLRFGVAVAIFASARRTYGVLPAFVIGVIVASLVNTFQEPVLLLIVLAYALHERLERRGTLLLSAASGAFAAFELLNKVSIGVTLAVMTAIFVICLPRGWFRAALAAVAGFAIVLIVLWLALDQPLSALPNYLHASEQISSGYSAAMSIDNPGYGWLYTAALIAVVVGVWGALHMTVWDQPRQRWGIVLLWLFFCFSAFKEGFVRYEPGHIQIFLAAVLGGFFAFRWRSDGRRVALLATVMLVGVFLAGTGQSLTGFFDPTRSVAQAFDDVRYGLSASRRAGIINAGRQAIMASEPLTPAELNLLRGRTVSIFPYEISIAWAYHLDWRPIPVIQSYSAYTSYLDKLDADFLASDRAPERLVMQNLSDDGIDGRILSFDEPQTSIAIRCHYRLLHTGPAYAILARVPDQCSSPTLITTYRVDWGQPVPVPPPPTPRSFVLVRINGVQVGGLERIRDLLWKPVQRSVVVNGVSARLIEGTAGDGLPLVASNDLDFPPPYNLFVGVHTIAVTKQRSGPTGGRPITYSFYTESFNPARAGGNP